MSSNTIIEFLSTPHSEPFAIALILMVFLATTEVIGWLFASSPAHILDALLPDFHIDAGNWLDWLHIGKVPTLIVFILFLTGFSLAGFGIQWLSMFLTGMHLQSWLAALPAIFFGLFNASLFGGIFARIMPAEESRAVSEQSLIGKTAIISEGTAKRHLAAQAKVRDEFRFLHYILVEPEADNDTFSEGEKILISRKKGALYFGTRIQ